MKRVIPTVSAELKQYCPLTMGEIVGAWLLVVVPWTLLAFAALVTILMVTRVIGWSGNVGTCTVFAFLIGACFFVVPERRNLIRQAKDRRNRNNEGYWMFYIVNPAGDQMRVIGPLTKEARDAILRERTDDDWLYFMVPLHGKEDGIVFNGERHSKKTMVQAELGWWRVRPEHLATYYSDLASVRLVLVDREDAVLSSIPILVTALFLRAASVGWLGERRNNLRMALHVILNKLLASDRPASGSSASEASAEATS